MHAGAQNHGKAGKARQKNAHARLPTVLAYTKQELYDLWLMFKDAENAEKMLSDFAQCDKTRARELIGEFKRVGADRANQQM